MGNCTHEDRRRLRYRKTVHISISVDEPCNDTGLSGPSYPPINGLLISVQGVEKLQTAINPNKAAGTDQVPCHILKEVSTTLPPVLVAILTKSLKTGTRPLAWKTAFVSPWWTGVWNSSLGHPNMVEASLGRNFQQWFRCCYTSWMGDTCRVWSFDAYLCRGHRLIGVNDGTSPDEGVTFHRGIPKSHLLFSCWMP